MEKASLITRAKEYLAQEKDLVFAQEVKDILAAVRKVEEGYLK